VQRRVELGARIVLAAGRVEELAAVDQAVNAGRDQVGDVVDELAPFGALGEPQGARALDQLAGIVRCGCPRREGGEQEKKAPWPAPRGLVLRVQWILA
jgi:hypothetical protein